MSLNSPESPRLDAEVGAGDHKRMEMTQNERRIDVLAREFRESEEQRRATLEALKDEIWAEVQAGELTMKEIVERAGVARATVYAVVQEKEAAGRQAEPAAP